MNKEELDESPYCEICGTCGCIECCGIRNFISEHIEGKTNCKNEGWIIQDLINLCDYKDEVFKENKKLNNIISELEKWLKGLIDNFDESVSEPILHEQMTIRLVYDYLENLKQLKEKE